MRSNTVATDPAPSSLFLIVVFGTIALMCERNESSRNKKPPESAVLCVLGR